MKEIKIFSPATVANISCGFDVLGLALDSLGDEMIFRKTTTKGIIIKKIEGAKLPYETSLNVAGVVAKAMFDKIDVNFGIEIEIYKNFKPGSGLGSSAASAAGTAFAVNELLDKPFNSLELANFAVIGEKLACGAPIADNVAPAIFGGFTLVRDYNPLDIIKLNTPKDLYVNILHPQIEIRTEDARTILSDTVPLKKAIKQWGNVGALVSGLYTENYELISKSLIDVIVEPQRSKLIPYFDLVKKIALKNGALGGGISGSGPSIFALSKGSKTADKVQKAMNSIYDSTTIKYNSYVSKINNEGIKIISQI